MANPWFRMYGEFVSDPKVQMLSETDQRRYVMLLCIRCGNDDETFHDEAMAFQLRISDEEWSKTKSTLMTKNLIDKRNHPTSWNKRQYQSDVSTSRVSKHRNKIKRSCNVSETLPEADTDSYTEQNRTEESILAPEALAEKKTIKKSTQLPKDWRPNESHRSKCRELGFDADTLADEERGFINHHLARASKFADWDRAFWTWIGNASKFSGSTKTINGKRTYADSVKTAAEAANNFHRKQESLRSEDVF